MPRRAGLDGLDRMVPRLFGYALALTADRHQAEDLTQDCLARALGAGQVPRRGSLAAWLFTILRNLHIDGLRRRRTAPVAVDEAVDEGDLRPFQAESRVIEALALREAMAGLPALHRQVLMLVDVNGCSYAEAARRLDVSPGTVASRLARARAGLLHALERDA